MQIWNDDSGDRYEVGADRDGLDMVELRYYDPDGKICSSIQLPLEVWQELRKYAHERGVDFKENINEEP